ncbi:MAG TPA: sulfite exporter TauE/SafE family protein [Actinobacteria bacterium]|nr:sulfite exporter TauE/SafE family protein [Actinomycetota bacterium]
MVGAFLLGLTGSLGHCVGMCGGVALLLGGAGAPPARLLRLHVGRVATYTLLGAGVGFFGASLETLGRGAAVVQGLLALGAAGIAWYSALALVGRVPALDRALAGPARRWRGLVGEAVASRAVSPAVLGAFWGLLPCGLVLVALSTAASTSSAPAGAATMLAFGLGTVPALVALARVRRLEGTAGGGVATATRQRLAVAGRLAAVVVLALVGSQMALRGLAAFGIVGHGRLGGLVLW